jgi:hypothetical protein
MAVVTWDLRFRHGPWLYTIPSGDVLLVTLHRRVLLVYS